MLHTTSRPGPGTGLRNKQLQQIVIVVRKIDHFPFYVLMDFPFSFSSSLFGPGRGWWWRPPRHRWTKAKMSMMVIAVTEILSFFNFIFRALFMVATQWNFVFRVPKKALFSNSFHLIFMLCDFISFNRQNVIKFLLAVFVQHPFEVWLCGVSNLKELSLDFVLERDVLKTWCL
jgi:hypothetical protein